jgi:SNF2 family DNA or RNA helicase
MLDRGRVLLAYPQGAGKTPVTLYVLESLRAEFGDDFRGLIITTGLKSQWRDFISEFTGGTQVGTGRYKKWVGGVPSIVVQGPPERRAKLYAASLRGEAPYTVVGYEQVVSDYSMICKLQRDFLVGDEITAIKNPAADRSQALKTLDASFVYGLTGDPIENGRPEELFSIMEWVDSTVLGRADLFDKTFIVRNPKNKKMIVRYRNLPEFYDLLEPAMARIDEDDPRLAKYMPRSRPPVTHWVHLDDASADLYELMADALLADLAQAAEMRQSGFDLAAHYAGIDPAAHAMQGKLMAKIAAIRMLCDDPDALITSAQTYLAAPVVYETRKTRDGKTYRAKKKKDGSAYAAKLYLAGELDELSEAPKLTAVRRRLQQILDAEPDNKIIVFCTYKEVLRQLEVRYPGQAILYTGDQTPNQRDRAKAAFQNEPEIRLFLSSDAGGYGVDLPQANYLLNIDRPYSAGKKKQRNTRHRRASSLWKEIHVENFTVAGSLEEYYDARLLEKQAVAAALLDGRGINRRGELHMSADSLTAFLRQSQV